MRGDLCRIGGWNGDGAPYPTSTSEPSISSGRMWRLRAPAGYPTVDHVHEWNSMCQSPSSSWNGVWPPGPVMVPRVASTASRCIGQHGPTAVSQCNTPTRYADVHQSSHE